MSVAREVVKACKISQITINNVKIGTKKVNKKVSVRYQDKPLVIQTPLLEIMGPLKKTAHPNIYQLETLFRGDNKNKISEWYEFIDNIETEISNQVVKNGIKWFTSKNININSLIKEQDPQENTFFVRWLVKLETNIFVDADRNSFNPSMLKEKDLVKLIVEIPDLWIEENQCGLATLVQKIMVKPYLEKVITEYDFNDTESEESEESEGSDKAESIMSLLATDQRRSQQQSFIPHSYMTNQNNINNQANLNNRKNSESIKNVKQSSGQSKIQNARNLQSESIKQLTNNVKEMTNKKSNVQDHDNKNHQKNFLESDDDVSMEDITQFKRFSQRKNNSTFSGFSSDGINEEDLDFNDDL